MGLKFRRNRGAFAALRTLPGVVALIEETTLQMCSEANGTLAEGEGYNSAVHRGVSRRGPYVVGRVWTRTTHAQRSNAKYNTLARIVGSK